MSRIDTLIVKAENIEIRGCKEIEGTIKSKDPKKADTVYKYLEVKIDDENEETHYLKDKAVEEHKDLYKRGTMGTMYLAIITQDISKENSTFVQEKTKVLIHDFIPDKA